jgi:hypothetical protein
MGSLSGAEQRGCRYLFQMSVLGVPIDSWRSWKRKAVDYKSTEELCLEVDLIYIRINGEVKLDLDSFCYRKGEWRVNLQIRSISLSIDHPYHLQEWGDVEGYSENTAVTNWTMVPVIGKRSFQDSHNLWHPVGLLLRCYVASRWMFLVEDHGNSES